MSMRSDAGVCRQCGAVDLAENLVRIERQTFAYVCRGCAKGTEVAPRE